jgi:hypothetical protein
MSIMIVDTEVETALLRHSDHQPTRPSKTALTLAILRRAVQMTPEEMDRWLRGQSCCDEQHPDAA